VTRFRFESALRGRLVTKYGEPLVSEMERDAEPARGFRFEPSLRDDLHAALGEPCTRELEREMDHYRSMRDAMAALHARGIPRLRGRRHEVARDNLATGVYLTLLRRGLKVTAARPVGRGIRRPRAVAPSILRRVLDAAEPGHSADTLRLMRSAKRWAERVHAIELAEGAINARL